MKLVRALVVGGAVALAAGGSASSDSATLLNGRVGPEFTISLMRNGKAFKKLEAGTYRLHVWDRADIHDFNLVGPGVDEDVTGVEFVGKASVNVTLVPGKYRFFCEVHPSQMHGSFTVANP
jgi:plastocyanin